LLVAGLAMTFTGTWMAWSSRVGKLREREQLLDRIAWRGDEAVLDVGCGRGLLLVGAAKRLRAGHATGIDLWQAEDLAGNRPEATLENARLEGVTGYLTSTMPRETASSPTCAR
jgi:ribosomal protein L11 methylase PrmA